MPLMDKKKGYASIQSREEVLNALDLKLPGSFVQIPRRLTNFLKSHLKNNLLKAEGEGVTVSQYTTTATTAEGANHLDKQLKSWRENPAWVDQDPEIEVKTKGSTCNFHGKVNVGLPPEGIYNIITDPGNKRVFQNIEEVISRKVLVDEGLRQVVEVKQRAAWRFLWWSGTISANVSVDQNKQDHSVKYNQLKSGLMKKLEGCWTLEPLFVDEHLCFPFKPKTLEDYNCCTGGKGRVGSTVSLEHVVQPAIVPPPMNWYLGRIVARNTELVIKALVAEATRIRVGDDITPAKNDTLESSKTYEDSSHQDTVSDIYVDEPPK